MELLTYSVTVLCVCQVGTQPYRYCFLFTVQFQFQTRSFHGLCGPPKTVRRGPGPARAVVHVACGPDRDRGGVGDRARSCRVCTRSATVRTVAPALGSRAALGSPRRASTLTLGAPAFRRMRTARAAPPPARARARARCSEAEGPSPSRLVSTHDPTRRGAGSPDQVPGSPDVHDFSTRVRVQTRGLGVCPTKYYAKNGASAAGAGAPVSLFSLPRHQSSSS